MIAVGGKNPEAESDNEERTGKTELYSLTEEVWSLEKDYPFGSEYVILKSLVIIYELQIHTIPPR